MTITLNHTIVPARDKVAAAEFFAQIFGLPVEGAGGHFAPVRVNGSLTLDFASATGPIASQHYAFHVSDAEFDAIFGRIQAEGIPYGSEPHALTNRAINHRGGGRGVYFCDPNGHILELLTVG